MVLGRVTLMRERRPARNSETPHAVAVVTSSFVVKEYSRTLYGQKKPYFSAKLFMKKFLASNNICSRFSGDKVIRTLVNTPAMLGNNN